MATSSVPYDQADEPTKTAYLDGLKRLRGIEGNPAQWHCGICGTTTAGDEIGLTYGEDVITPLPVCPHMAGSHLVCAGIGPDLTPAAAES
jgi:hypothetical protein